jgi:hypothetical protein
MATVYYTQKIDLCQRWLCPSLVQISWATTPNAQDKAPQRDTNETPLKKTNQQKKLCVKLFFMFFDYF